MGMNNSEELPVDDQEQADETQNQQPPEQPGVDSGEEQFTQVDITQINRDDLTPPMQAAYDRMLEMYSNMQSHFTQRNQEASAVQRDAEIWQSVRQNPELLRVMNDAIYRIHNNMPLDNTQAQQPAEIPDPAQDPMGAIEAVVNKVLAEQLGQYMPGLQQDIRQVTGFVQNNQAQLEFDNLCNTYPAARTIGFPAIDQVRNQYRNSSGQPISMAEALSLMARGNPRLLQQSTARQQPRPKPRVPPVEQPKQQRGSTVPMPPPEGVRGLRARVEEQRKSGTLGNLQSIVGAALAKISGGR